MSAVDFWGLSEPLVLKETGPAITDQARIHPLAAFWKTGRRAIIKPSWILELGASLENPSLPNYPPSRLGPGCQSLPTQCAFGFQPLNTLKRCSLGIENSKRFKVIHRHSR